MKKKMHPNWQRDLKELALVHEPLTLSEQDTMEFEQLTNNLKKQLRQIIKGWTATEMKSSK